MSENVIICVPTITGREESFQRTVDGYKDTVDGSEHNVALVTVLDQPTWGAGVEACMAAVHEQHPEATIIHFSADDLVPEPGWLDVAVETVNETICPAPVLDTFGVINYGHPPTPDMTDWKVSQTSVIPTIRASWWKLIAPMFVGQYFTDDFISLKLRMHGIDTKGRTGYRFKHFHENVGRGAGMTQDERMQYDMDNFRCWQRTGKLPSREEQIGRPS